MVGGDGGYTGVEKHPEHEGREVLWQIAARRSTYTKLGKRSALYKTWALPFAITLTAALPHCAAMLAPVQRRD
jgi:hypothetical protein